MTPKLVPTDKPFLVPNLLASLSLPLYLHKEQHQEAVLTESGYWPQNWSMQLTVGSPFFLLQKQPQFGWRRAPPLPPPLHLHTVSVPCL